MIGTLLTGSLVLGLAPALPPQEAPPGLVLVKGGRTTIGTSVKEIERIVVEENGAKTVANTLIGETPQHTVEVADFYLMPTEVTNEQYAAFVRATGAKPPHYWGSKEAIEAGRIAFLEEQGRKRQEAVAEGRTPERQETFDLAKWWEANWEGQEWSMPEDGLTKPVTFVSYEDARRYAAWAGLRLMTESEFQRAARRDTDRVYPWGNDWKDGYCNSLEYKQDGGMPVASFPDGAVEGVHDLIGNVYEWTATPYLAYPGYKAVEIQYGREKLEPLAGFDASQRVVVGGAFTAPSFGCRISMRQGVSKWQTTDGIGFRCAADTIPGKTPAEYVVEEDVRVHRLPGTVKLEPESTAVLQRWESEPGTVDVEGYQVVTAYERLLFTPVVEVDAASEQELARKTEGEPVVLGMLSMPHPMMQPELDGGTYFLAWRGEGRLPEAAPAASDGQVEQEELAFAQLPGFDPEVATFFLYDLEGRPIVAWPAAPIDFQRPKEGTQVAFEKFVPPPPPEDGEEAPPVVPMDTVRFSVVVDAKSRKALLTTLELKLAPGRVTEEWK